MSEKFSTFAVAYMIEQEDDDEHDTQKERNKRRHCQQKQGCRQCRAIPCRHISKLPISKNTKRRKKRHPSVL